jgi:hypothetical protein
MKIEKMLIQATTIENLTGRVTITSLQKGRLRTGECTLRDLAHTAGTNRSVRGVQ